MIIEPFYLENVEISEKLNKLLDTGEDRICEYCDNEM